MSKINVLSSNIFNRIAAGEVVERPFSVVKELLENSIDAQSTDITVEILSAGFEKISIIDNGIGILKEDLVKAYLPHATSKIASVEDLENIKTLGFRGEAVASIASVSKMNITSRADGQEFAYSLNCNGGELGEIEPAALEKGTVVTVSNLFFNTPVRIKFLKSQRVESGDITNIVSKIAIGNPDVKFKLVIDNKTIFQTFGDGFKNAVAAVYGLTTLDNCFLIDAIKNGIRIYGFIGKHNFTKPNKSYQSLYVNGRFVASGTVSSAVGNAYFAYLMKRQYPFFILKIDMPHSAVDVNVHPNKTEIRFENNQIIYSTVYSTIAAVLDGTEKAVEIVKSGFDVQEKASQNSLFLESNSKQNTQSVKKTQMPIKELEKYKGESVNLDGFKVCDHTYVDLKNTQDMQAYKANNVVDDASEFLGQEKLNEPKQHTDDSAFLENKRFLENQNSQNDILAKFTKSEPQEQIAFDIKNFNYVGQAFNTYLIYTSCDQMYLIDQHAAHERLIFDKFLSEFENRNIVSQPLLMPIILNLNYAEFDFIKQKLGFLHSFGFDIVDFGGTTLKINEIPAMLSVENTDRFFKDLLSDIDNINKNDSNYLRNKIATTACKAATKGGDSLNEKQANALFVQLDGNFGLKCPHGRPVVVKLTKTEIEKWFKRIV